MSGQKEEGIDLSQLTVDQLKMLKEQLENDLERFAESFSSLQTAANRFHNSGLASEALSKEEEGEFQRSHEGLITLRRKPYVSHLSWTVRGLTGKPMMIPLTSSLYVSGTLGSTDKVLVDVGTGYYVEGAHQRFADGNPLLHMQKSPMDGTDFCKRKVLMLKDNMEKLHMVPYNAGTVQSAQVILEKRRQHNQVAQMFQAKMVQAQKAAQKA
eukprot:80012-Prorocentrum_minimum.AAC.1